MHSGTREKELPRSSDEQEESSADLANLILCRLRTCRKTQRAKEIARNKKERSLQRDAYSKRDDPESLKEQLKEVIAAEQAGKSNPTLRLKKKALQSAYEQAIKRQMVSIEPKNLGLGHSSVGGIPVLQLPGRGHG